MQLKCTQGVRLIELHEYLGLPEVSIKHVFYDTLVEPMLKKFTTAFSEISTFSRWRKIMSNCEFECIWGLLITHRVGMSKTFL